MSAQEIKDLLYNLLFEVMPISTAQEINKRYESEFWTKMEGVDVKPIKDDDQVQYVSKDVDYRRYSGEVVQSPLYGFTIGSISSAPATVKEYFDKSLDDLVLWAKSRHAGLKPNERMFVSGPSIHIDREGYGVKVYGWLRVYVSPVGPEYPTP